MASYVSYFFEHAGQVWALISIALIWLGFTFIGAAVPVRGRMVEADPFCGWSLVALLFVAAGTLTAIPLTPLAVVAAAVALVAVFVVHRRGADYPFGAAGKMALLGLPLLLLASAVSFSQWDEFTDWGIIPRYLLATDHLPGRDNPFPNAVYIGYPYGWHLIGYFAGRITGGLVESAGAVMNVAILLSFGLINVRLFAEGAGRDDWRESAPWPLLAFGGLAATLLCPTFAQKVAITSYADTASAVIAGVAAVLAWKLIGRLADRNDNAVGGLAWQLGLTFMLLVAVKQATFVLFVILVIAMIMIVLRDPAVRIMSLIARLPQIVGPPVAMYLLWRFYVSNELRGGEFAVRPLEDWFVALIPQIVATMALVLAKKGYYLALVLLTLGFGIRGFWRMKTEFDRFAVLVALAVLGYEAFLLFAYVTSFGKYDALRAASFWRYNMHLGLIVTAFTVFAAGHLYAARLAGRPWLAKAKYLPVILILVAPMAFAGKIRFDKEPWVAHYRHVGAALQPYLQGRPGLFVFDPKGSGESAAIIRYETDGRVDYKGYLGAFNKTDADSLVAILAQTKASYVVVLSVRDDTGRAFGDMALRNDRTYLLARDADDPRGWRIVADWQNPEAR